MDVNIGRSIRTLVVEDYAPFRFLVSSMIRNAAGLKIVGEVADGLLGVRAAVRLQPDLITLDIQLPTLNGIEAARHIRKLSPDSRILFLTNEMGPNVLQAALETGAEGVLQKADLNDELFTAIQSVLAGTRFISRGCRGTYAPPSATEVAASAPTT